MDGEESESNGSVVDNCRGGIDEEHTSQPTRKRGRSNPNNSQTQKLEAFYKDCPYPDNKQKITLAQELGLLVNQVKFWFQNKRTLMKNLQNQVENDLLAVENAKLRIQHMLYRGNMANSLCTTCRPPAGKASQTSNVHHLISEKARLLTEFARISGVAMAGIKSYQMQSNLCNNGAETYGSAASIRTGAVEKDEPAQMAQGKEVVSQSILDGKKQRGMSSR